MLTSHPRSLRRRRTVRKLENKLRFRNRLCIGLGEINDKFFVPGWETVDLHGADHLCDFRTDPLPFSDDSVDLVYASHVIEHLWREQGAHLFQEVYRVLKPGGICRLLTPDLDIIIDRYRLDDWAWFFEFAPINKIKQRLLPPESILIHNRLLNWLASYSGRLGHGGGPIVDRATVDANLASMTKYEFRDWAVSLLDHNEYLAHVHVYDFDELSGGLKTAGFETVARTGFRESAVPVLGRRDRPRYESCSLIVEAQKASHRKHL